MVVVFIFFSPSLKVIMYKKKSLTDNYFTSINNIFNTKKCSFNLLTITKYVGFYDLFWFVINCFMSIAVKSIYYVQL